jgi:hypothetical protein
MNKNMIKTLLMSALAVTMALVFVGCKKDEAGTDATATPAVSPSASTSATPATTPDATPAATPSAPAGKMGDDKGKTETK